MSKKKSDFIDDMIETMETTMDKLDEIEKDSNLSNEEKEELLKDNVKQFSQMQEMMSSIMQKVEKKSRKKQKISKYHLSNIINKYKRVVLTILKVDENIVIDSTTNEMYSIIDDVLRCEEPYKRLRLSQMYSSTLRDTFSSFRDNVVDMIETAKKDGKDYIKIIEEFYGAYFGMVIKTITDKYNAEIEKLEKEKEEQEIKAFKETIDPDLTNSSDLIKELNQEAN